jgi:hypothetical protein
MIVKTEHQQNGFHYVAYRSVGVRVRSVTHSHAHSHSECVMLIAFPRQELLRERASMLHLHVQCLPFFKHQWIKTVPKQMFINRRSASTLEQRTFKNRTHTVFWDVTPYSLVDICRCFGRKCCFHIQGTTSAMYCSRGQRRGGTRRYPARAIRINDIT